VKEFIQRLFGKKVKNFTKYYERQNRLVTKGLRKPNARLPRGESANGASGVPWSDENDGAVRKSSPAAPAFILRMSTIDEARFSRMIRERG
jgi:hypothetical protein